MWELPWDATERWREWFRAMLEREPVGDRYRAMPVRRASREEAEAQGIRVRKASVLLMLFPAPVPGGRWVWRAVLMERTPHEGVHGGQVSIPGGEMEERDGGDALVTALREFAEETGAAVDAHAVVGRLQPLYIAPSAFYVEAFVAVLSREPAWAIDETEVAALLRPEVENWLRPDALQPRPVHVRPGLRAPLPAYEVEGRTVWGATAIWLTEFADAWRTHGDDKPAGIVREVEGG